MLSWVEHEKSFNCWYFYFYDQVKFYAQLSRARKTFYNLEARKHCDALDDGNKCPRGWMKARQTHIHNAFATASIYLLALKSAQQQQQQQQQQQGIRYTTILTQTKGTQWTFLQQPPLGNNPNGCCSEVVIVLYFLGRLSLLLAVNQYIVYCITDRLNI